MMPDVHHAFNWAETEVIIRNEAILQGRIRLQESLP